MGSLIGQIINTSPKGTLVTNGAKGNVYGTNYQIEEKNQPQLFIYL